MSIAEEYLGNTKAKISETVVDITDAVPDTTRLQRYLSTRSVLSTASSFAIRQQEAQETPIGPEKIGEGFCAEIFDLPGAGRVVKRARQDPTKTVELWRDFGSHLRIFESMNHPEAAGIDINVPKPSYFVTAADFAEWANVHQLHQYTKRTGTDKLPELLREQSAILVSERILPLPQTIRTALVNTFCPISMRQASLSDVKNKDCLIRIYLGVRRPNPLHHDMSQDFSLRNFELTLDKMQHLNIDPLQFVPPIAEALAVMHWDARRDATDVEFVLGSAPESRITARDFDDMDKDGGLGIQTTWQRPKRMPQDTLDFSRRAVSMWLLDFNQVERLQMNDEGMKKIRWAFWNNDPYYPRPEETRLWDAFKKAYLARSARIDDDSPRPQRFIDGIEADAKARLSANQGPPKAGPSSSPAPPIAPGALPMAHNTKEKKGKKHRKYASIA
ncbi:zinc finger protein-domain-containing protein [Plectosphaerella plurivora]|uniref:Zinc finger protein-domain-containing protein n=1 Tax=Plectosphaerella plurivora TaxID=936078 RepID=A0A9P8VGE5_9PEZI|nr:zinc finger protein-domain-containing protein [Plectosphaerella plurivora]